LAVDVSECQQGEIDPVPTYQYVCTSCAEGLEVHQSFSDAALTECRSCGGRLRKVFGAVGVVFKGSGFYRTDSRAAESKGAEGDSSDGKPAATKESGSGPDASPKADVKPATAKAEAASAPSKGSAA